MTISPFALVGALVANGPGVLLLAALAAGAVLVWDWRWSLTSTAVVMLGATGLSAALHHPNLLVSASQWLAILVATLLLGMAGHLYPISASPPASSNWLVRLIAVGFMLGAWWVVDPGVSLPLFTQVETDLLLWTGLCGLLMVALSSAPIQNGIGLLLMTAPLQVMAPVLLPGSGLGVIVGIGQILLALACAYLILAQPLPHPEQEPLLPVAARQALANQLSRRGHFPRLPVHKPPLPPVTDVVATHEPRLESSASAEKTA